MSRYEIQQNSCSPTSNNLEILLMRHLRRVVPRLLFTFAFYQIKASSVKQADLGAKFKKASKSVCTSNVVSPDFLSLSAVKTLKRTRNQQMEIRYPHEILLCLVLQTKCRSSNKKLPIRTLVSIGTN